MKEKKLTAFSNLSRRKRGTKHLPPTPTAMRYYKRFYTCNTPIEITYEEALKELLEAYKDTPKNRSRLQSRDKIKCLFCELIIEE